MPLRLENLERSIVALEGALVTSMDETVMGALSEIGQNTMRSGVIQHFGFTYEICRVLIERWLRANFSRDVLSVSRKDLYRIAGERDLIDGVERWFNYHQERNRTSHRYDEELLQMIDDTIPAFVDDAKSLLQTFKSQNA